MATNVPGLEISELMPRQARVMDKLDVDRLPDLIRLTL